MNRVLQKALGATQIPLIVAHDSRKVANIKLRRFRDEKAGTSLLINDTMQPFSPITGNPLVPEHAATITIKASDVKELVPFAENKEVGVVYRTTSAIANVLNAEGKGSDIFCVVSQVKVPVKVHQKILATALAADAVEDDPFQDDSLDDPSDAQFNTDDDDTAGFDADADAVGGDDMGAMGDDAGVAGTDVVPPAPDAAVVPPAAADAAGTDAPVASPDAGAADAAAVPGADAVPDAGLTDADFDLGGDAAGAVDAPPPADTGAVPGEDSAPGATSDEDEDDMNTHAEDTVADGGGDSINSRDSNDTSMASYKYDLLETTASAEQKPTFDIVLGGGDNAVYYVMANHQPVAVAFKDKASEGLQKVFHNVAKFQHMFYDAVASDGLTGDVMTEFGIEPISIEVNANQILASQVEAATAEVQASFDERSKKLDEVLRQSISIAAMALNKGFFKDEVNPLRSALCEELAANNVRNPERIVDQVFATHGEDYHRQMLERAFKLSQDSDETRNTVAKLVEEASYQPMKVEASERVTARLTNGNEPKVSKMEETASDGSQSSRPQFGDVQALRARLGLTRPSSAVMHRR